MTFSYFGHVRILLAADGKKIAHGDPLAVSLHHEVILGHNWVEMKPYNTLDLVATSKTSALETGDGRDQYFHNNHTCNDY